MAAGASDHKTATPSTASLTTATFDEEEEIRAEIIEASAEIEERIEQAKDNQAELVARVAFEAQKERYLSTYESAYREDMREALTEQWREEVAVQRHLALVRRRAAFLLLLAH